MAKSREAFNPFYLLLVMLGVAFCISACVYGVMTVQGIRVDLAVEPSPLIEFFERHGGSILGVELALLAVATFGAIGTDHYWQQRAAKRKRLSGEQPLPDVSQEPSAQHESLESSRP